MDLIKPDLDTKEYRIIKLPNGLRAICVSDVQHLITLPSSDTKEESDEPQGDNSVDGDDKDEEEENEDDNEIDNDDEAEAGEKMAACALCVAVGSFSDPPEIPGLAHFLEHMVFMGSAKYPKENALDDFIKKRGGSNNAVTDFEHTTFHIECREAHLAEALDLFANFFISPLIMKEAMTREREAIDSEFELALPSDGSRFEQLLGSLAPEGHPGRCFPWGNKVTLVENVEDDVLHGAVREFWKRHYSAHRMTVAVVARLPLDTIEDYIRTNFSSIPSNNVPAIDLSQHKTPWGSEFHRLLWVDPTHDLCQVVLTWVLPSLEEHYEAKPLSYLSSIIGHEGKGSLLWHLKRKVLALKSMAGNDGSGFEFNSLFSTFGITLDLTENGMDQLEEVLNIVFCYIAMLQANLPNERCFEELRDITKANFKYRDELEAAKYAEELCESMHFYQSKHYICGDDLYLAYKPDLIKSIVESLRYDNVNIAIHRKGKPDEFYTEEEPWFKTKFKAQEIPEEWKKNWAKATPLPEFHLPPPNPYVTRVFDLLPVPIEQPLYPVKVVDTALLEVWYRQDIKFKQPVAHFTVYVTSPNARSSALNAALLDILVAYLHTALESKFYPAREAGYGWSCSAADFGLLFKFVGYSEHMVMLYGEVLVEVTRVMETLGDPESVGLFEPVKKDVARGYHNTFISTDDLNRIVRLSLLLDQYWMPMTKLEVVTGATIEQLKTFWTDLVSSSRAQILVQGNVTRETAVQIGNTLVGQFQMKCLATKPQVRIWKMNAGKEVLCRVPSFNSADNNAVTTNYYQYEPSGKSVKAVCIADLVMMLMNEPLFDSLRTQQQIGYDVSAEVRDTFGVVGFSVTAAYPCAKFTADHVDNAIQTFLKQFVVSLRDLPPAEFEEVQESLIAMKKVMDTALQDEVTRNFAEISSGEYMFDRLPQEIAAIGQLSQQEVCDWLEGVVKKNMKKLSIQVVSCNRGVGVPSEDSSGKDFKITPMSPSDKFIKNLDDFRRQREFYPPQKAA